MAGKGVRTTHPKYDEYAPIWAACSDAVDGQRAIHRGGEKYLARLKDEDDASYKARITRSDYFNATWRTISGLTGLAFRKEPVIDAPAAILPMLDDINLAGVSLEALAKDLTEDVLQYGRIGLMVDHPLMAENVTSLSLASSEAMGLRPTIQTYSAKSIINWRYARVRNRFQLVMVVVQEQADIGENEFETEYENRYRVLDLDQARNYRQRVFRINKKDQDEQVGADIYPLMNNVPLSYVPFQIIGPNGKSAECDEPPLINLIDKNIAHYRVNSDYRHGLHFTGLPTPVVSGYIPESGAAQSLYIGSTSAWVFPDPNAKASYLEFTGVGLSELREAIKALEQQMAALGARMIVDETRHVETLGAVQLKRAGENSVLAAVVNAVSESIEWALDIFAQWAGASGTISYAINTRFTPVAMGAQELTALVSAWQSGAVSDGELFANLQEGEVIDGAKTLEQHQAEVDIPAMPRPTAITPIPVAA